MLEKMESLESEFNDIIKLPIEDAETSAKAKALRLKYVKVRTGTAEIHKQQKAFYLSAGRFIDGWKNTQLFASQGIEEKLEGIEKYQEMLEEKRIEALQRERQEALAPYDVENVEQLALGMMTDEIWNNFILGMKTSHEQKVAAEKKAEEDRIALEKKEAAEREAQRLENIRLKAEAEAKEKALELERKAAAEAQAKADAEAKKLQEAADKKLKAEQDKAAELSAKLRAKEDEEKRIQEEKKTAEKKALAAPDKAKLVALAGQLDLIAIDIPAMKSSEAKAIVADAKTLIAKLTTFIKEKSAKI